MMNYTLKCRVVADAMAATAAGYVVLAPPRHKEIAMQSTLEGFRNACSGRGVLVRADDLEYYLAIVEAKVTEITARLGNVGHA
jgi:hypothetical protein